MWLLLVAAVCDGFGAVCAVGASRHVVLGAAVGCCACGYPLMDAAVDACAGAGVVGGCCAVGCGSAKQLVLFGLGASMYDLSCALRCFCGL